MNCLNSKLKLKFDSFTIFMQNCLKFSLCSNVTLSHLKFMYSILSLSQMCLNINNLLWIFNTSTDSQILNIVKREM